MICEMASWACAAVVDGYASETMAALDSALEDLIPRLNQKTLPGFALQQTTVDNGFGGE